MSSSVETTSDEVRSFVREEEARLAAIAPDRPFVAEEYETRQATLRRHMNNAGIDVLVATSPDTMCWLTGYAARWYRSGASTHFPPCQCVVVHAAESHPFMIETAFHEQLARLTACISDVRLLPDTGLIREPGVAEFVGFLIDNLTAERWLGGTVGLEAFSWVPSPAVWRAMVDGLEAAGCAVVDATRTARAARRQKSAAEIAYIERAQSACDAGIRALQRAARPGMSGLEGWKHFVTGVIEAGGEPAAIHETVFAGPPEPMAHLLSTRTPIVSGDYFHPDAAASFERYHARCMRVLSMGPPPPALVRLTAIAGGALEVVRKGRAGQPFGQLRATLREYFMGEGVAEEEFFAGGYELGISFAPDWVGEFVWSAHDPDDESPIPEGLVTNFESCAFVAVVDTVVFEPGGARTLSSIPAGEVLLAGE
jgi:Xaa-Pro aminopeptidase